MAVPACGESIWRAPSLCWPRRGTSESRHFACPQGNITLGAHRSCADITFASGRQCACISTDALPHTAAELETGARPALTRLPGWPTERLVHVWVWAGARPFFLRVGGC